MGLPFLSHVGKWLSSSCLTVRCLRQPPPPPTHMSVSVWERGGRGRRAHMFDSSCSVCLLSLSFISPALRASPVDQRLHTHTHTHTVTHLSAALSVCCAHSPNDDTHILL